MNVYNCRFLKPFHINAIVLYPFVLYCEKHPDELIKLHEQVHLDQIKRDGFWRFYVRYLLQYWQGRRLGLSHYEAYRNISYEQEAFQVELPPKKLAVTKSSSSQP